MGPPAYSKWMWADEFGPRISLLERLFAHYKQCNTPSNNPSPSPEESSGDTLYIGTPYVALLTENYRCHEKILEFPSDNFYGGELIARGDQSTLKNVPVLSFYTAQGVDQQDEGGLAYYNDAEVAEVVARVKELILLWPKDWAKSIGVLTPYHDQVTMYIGSAIYLIHNVKQEILEWCIFCCNTIFKEQRFITYCQKQAHAG